MPRGVFKHKTLKEGRKPEKKGVKKGKCGVYKRTKEHRKKLSEAQKGRKQTIKTRMKLSRARKGKNGSNWRGGIWKKNEKLRKCIEFRLWREAVFARDNWTCQKSGIKGGKLHPHHIKNFAEFPELRFSIDNGITLSEKEHRNFHNKFGQRNNNEKQLTKFLNIKIWQN